MTEKGLEDLLNEKEIPNLTIKQEISLKLLKEYCREFYNRYYETKLFTKDLVKLYKEKILPEEIISEIVFTTLEYSKKELPDESKRVYNVLSKYLNKYEKSRK